jgi:hypothetical protein
LVAEIVKFFFNFNFRIIAYILIWRKKPNYNFYIHLKEIGYLIAFVEFVNFVSCFKIKQKKLMLYLNNLKVEWLFLSYCTFKKAKESFNEKKLPTKDDNIIIF